MEKFHPSISILLLCWNHEPYLRDCISALSKQLDQDFEVIFLDNKSSDSSFEKATRLFSEYAINATIIRNETPSGVAHNFNKLLGLSNGDLICPLSTDDWYLPNFTKIIRQAAIAEPDVSWFFGMRASIVDSGDINVESHDYADGDIRPLVLRGVFPINLNGGAYRKLAVTRIGGWDDAMLLEDIDLIFRLSEHGTCRFLREPLAVYRSHDGGISKKNDYVIDGVGRFYSKHGHRFRRNGKFESSDAVRQIAARSIDIGDFRESLRVLWKAFMIDPRNFSVIRTAFYLARRALGSLFPKRVAGPAC